jgi:hypothetical protein
VQDQCVVEVPLPGGFINCVVRIDDTVRRPTGAGSGFVQELLGLFEQTGWTGAPRFLGIDEQDRQILQYLPGHVAWEPVQPPQISDEQSLIAMARLVRQFHDLTAGTALAGDHEVICHNDLSPKNTVYQNQGAGLRPVAFIDWDLAAPGARIHDLAHVCWQYLGLGSPDVSALDAAPKLRLICDAYGLADRSELVPTILWWQDRCRRGIQAQALDGDHAMAALSKAGVPDTIRNSHVWVTQHRQALEAALLDDDA